MTYQYVTLDSDLEKNESREIVLENDTVRISYSFDGVNCPATIRVYNKLDKPMYVDWQRSAFIVNGHALPIAGSKSKINAETTGIQFRSNRNTSTTAGDVISTSVGELNGVITEPLSRGFMAPRSFIESDPVELTTTMFNVEGADWTRSKEGANTVKYVDFEKANTPLLFRCFLTLSDHKDFETSFHFENEFWVQKITTAALGPRQMIWGTQRDRFYIAKMSGVGAGSTLVVGGFLIALGVAADKMEP
jgi:hypothetical protein